MGGRGKGVGGRGREWEGNRLGKKEVGRRVRRKWQGNGVGEIG